jgi:hypothetical protein
VDPVHHSTLNNSQILRIFLIQGDQTASDFFQEAKRLIQMQK